MLPWLTCKVTDLLQHSMHCCLHLARPLSPEIAVRPVVATPARQRDCGNARRAGATGDVTLDDVDVVMKRIEMAGWRDGGCELECGGALALLEEKEASLEELWEAFYVFDRNEDGYISPEELWSVMRRLGMEEGRRLEDCRRMISVFDEDGDGRIDFKEFKRLLEFAS